MKKRRIRPWALAVVLGGFLAIIVGFCLVVSLLFNLIRDGGVKSANAGAGKYRYGKCVVFYPKGDLGKSVAKTMCIDKDERVIDYTDTAFGEFHHISYDGYDYFTNEDYEEYKLTGAKNTKEIVANYLRYDMKKDNIDVAYTSKFLEETFVDNIDLSDVKYVLVSETEVGAYFPKYDYTAAIPSCLMQGLFDQDLGVAKKEFTPVKYINKDRPILAFTFDDGPNVMEEYLSTSNRIVDTFYRYDSNATFFVVGSRLGQRSCEFIEYSVSLGNQYGSHTYSHGNLTTMSAYDMVDEITWPGNRLNDVFGYEMSVYRPPYGAINSTLKANQPYLAVLWNVDSTDWELHDCDLVFNKVIRETDDKDVILFHDIYDSTAKAIEKLVPYFIDEGYQLVTISEMLEVLDIDQSSISVFSGK